MKPSRRITIAATVLLIGCLTASVLLLRQIDRERAGATLEEVLYISSPTLLKRMSLGYDGLLADIYWTRAVQYFGDKLIQGSEHFDLLAPLLEITTTLDPHLLIAYEYGANFLAPKIPGGAGQPLPAVKLVEFGIRNNPNQWRLYYELGFIYYLELGDYANAEKAFADGAKVPNAHQIMPIMAARMAEHAGNLERCRAWFAGEVCAVEQHERGDEMRRQLAVRCERVDRWCGGTVALAAAGDHAAGPRRELVAPRRPDLAQRHGRAVVDARLGVTRAVAPAREPL